MGENDKKESELFHKRLKSMQRSINDYMMVVGINMPLKVKLKLWRSTLSGVIESKEKLLAPEFKNKLKLMEVRGHRRM